MDLMKILVIGKGAREHALCWHFAQSNKITSIWAAPGNGGSAEIPKTKNLEISGNNIHRITHFVSQNQIDFCFVNTEAALSAGLNDALALSNTTCFGPSAQAAQLETSVSFVRSFMTQHQIPSPDYSIFHDELAALNFIKTRSFPIIIKPDDPTTIPAIYKIFNEAEASHLIKQLFSKNHSNNTPMKILIEEFIEGHQFTLTTLTDSTITLPISTSTNYRHLLENNQGVLTGGMGACSPAPMITEQDIDKVMTEVINPTITALSAEGNAYFGFLSTTLVKTNGGEFKVLDFNCRLGDPDTQVLLPRLNANLIDLCIAAKYNQLSQQRNVINSKINSVAVIAASQGYPSHTQTGETIKTSDQYDHTKSQLFHAGTKRMDKQLLTGASRVFCATGWAEESHTASQYAYDCLRSVSWPSMIYRKD